MMLDHHHRIPQVHQAVQHVQQLAHVLEVQPRGRLIQDIERLAGLPPAQLARQLDALRFAARKRG